MPYKSDKQRRYLHALKPEVAELFDKHAGIKKSRALSSKEKKNLSRNTSKKR